MPSRRNPGSWFTKMQLGSYRVKSLWTAVKTLWPRSAATEPVAGMQGTPAAATGVSQEQSVRERRSGAVGELQETMDQDSAHL